MIIMAGHTGEPPPGRSLPAGRAWQATNTIQLDSTCQWARARDRGSRLAAAAADSAPKSQALELRLPIPSRPGPSPG